MKSLVKSIAMVFVFVVLSWGQGKKATLAEQKACYDQAQSVTAGRTASDGGSVISAVEHYRADEHTCYVLYGWSSKEGLTFMLDDAFEGQTVAQWFRTSGSAEGKTFKDYGEWDRFVHNRFLND